jgi:3-oxoacyl-[acyl-carrier protein] reductase
VAVAGRNQSHVEEATRQISAAGGEAAGIQADVASEKDVNSMVAQTLERFQRVDILVNNAAVNLPYRSVAELTLEEWNWVVGVNLTGSFLCARAVLPTMMAQRYGKIINLSSLGGRHGAAGRTPYRPTKAAIISFTECLAAEVKEFGIDVNAICPGAVETDMLREITGGRLPPKVAVPEDIAAVAVFLASEEGKGITGTGVDVFGSSNPLFGVATTFQR